MYRNESYQRIFSHLTNLKKTQKRTLNAQTKLELRYRIENLKKLMTITSG